MTKLEVHAALIAAFSLTCLVSRVALGQVETIQYDDGTPGGVYTGMAIGDAELVTITPEHPAEIKSISFWFTGPAVQTDVYIWEDWGEAGFPDWTAPPLFQASVTPTVDDWTEVVVPDGTVIMDPPRAFIVGQILSDADLHISGDGSAPAEGQERGVLYIGGSYYLVSDSDLMVRVDVEYFDEVDATSFTDITLTAGLDGVSARRVAWGDYDNDGDDDLLESGSRLFENDGGHFTEVSVESGIRNADNSIRCGGNGGVWADYDNDGHLDFYSTSGGFVPMCDTGPDGDWYCDRTSGGTIPVCLDGFCRLADDPWPTHDCLFHNEGDGTFSVVDESISPYDFSPTEGAGWGDYDNDGFVDLYVANYEKPTSWTGDGELGRGTKDLLWHNNGDGTFTDVTDTAFSTNCWGYTGRGVNWGDYDGDGLIDIFVSVYRLQPNCLWHNLGDGTFEEVAESAGVQGVRIGSSWGHTIGSQWMDHDNDGDLDLFTANLAHPRFIDFSDKSMLLINSGAPEFTFENVWADSGFLYQETNSEPAWGDYDNDGLVDIYVTDVYVGRLSELYRQSEPGTFVDVTYPTGTDVDNGWGAAWADIDGDGDLDLVTRSLFRNDEANDNHWLMVHLEGTDSNRAAIGTVVDVTCAETTFSRQVEGGKGTTNQNSLTLHFGLGDCAMAESLLVRWPSGLEETIEDVEVDRRLDLVEGSVVPAADEDLEPIADAPADGSTDGGEDPVGSNSGCGCSVVG